MRSDRHVGEDWLMNRIRIDTTVGTLEGTYAEPPVVRCRRAVLFLHGWMSDSERGYAHLPARLAQSGFFTLALDLPGHGGSGGDRDNLRYRDFFTTAVDAADELIRRSGCEELSVVGTSLGGFLAIRVAGVRHVDNLVLWVPTDFSDELVESDMSVSQSALTSEAFEWRSQAHSTFDSATLQAFSRFCGHTLIIEAANDEMVPHQTTQNYRDSGNPQAMIDYLVLANATHRLSMQPDKQHFAASVTEAWLTKHNPATQPDARSYPIPRKSVLSSVLARVYVDNIDDALPFYQELTGLGEQKRFTYRGMRLVKIGVFLLVQGADTKIRSHAATVDVTDVETVAQIIEHAGGKLLEGPAAGPNGPRLIAAHPDGTIVEYIQPR